MTTMEKLNWPREEDEKWAATVQLRLVLDLHAPDGLADAVLAEVHDAVTDTGRTALDLFGDPAQYARSAAEERIGEEHRARLDSHGSTPGERLTGSLAAFGIVGIVVAVVRWISDGPWWHASWSSLAGFVTVVLAAALICVAAVTRAAGRIVGAWSFAAGAAVTMGAGGTAAAFLPESALFDLPVLLLAAAGGVAIALAVLLPDTSVDRWVTRGCPGNDERWLSHLDGLLRGRHAMSASDARAHVHEARQHLASSGESAEDAFGRAEVYAMRLSEGPRREQRLARRNLYGVAIVALLLTATAAEKLRDPDLSSVWFWLQSAMAVYFIWYAIGAWRQAFAGRGNRDHQPAEAE